MMLDAFQIECIKPVVAIGSMTSNSNIVTMMNRSWVMGVAE